MVSSAIETYDKESEQIKVNVLHRSSTDPKWFIWPQLDLNGAEHVEWVVEDDSVSSEISKRRKATRAII